MTYNVSFTAAAQFTFLLMHMSKIFRVVTARKQTQVVPNWRPSKVEMQEAYMLHVKVSLVFLVQFFIWIFNDLHRKAEVSGNCIGR